jgi:hypothetical protein
MLFHRMGLDCAFQVLDNRKSFFGMLDLVILLVALWVLNRF